MADENTTKMTTWLVTFSAKHRGEVGQAWDHAAWGRDATETGAIARVRELFAGDNYELIGEPVVMRLLPTGTRIEFQLTRGCHSGRPLVGSVIRYQVPAGFHPWAGNVLHGVYEVETRIVPEPLSQQVRDRMTEALRGNSLPPDERASINRCLALQSSAPYIETVLVPPESIAREIVDGQVL